MSVRLLLSSNSFRIFLFLPFFIFKQECEDEQLYASIQVLREKSEQLAVVAVNDGLKQKEYEHVQEKLLQLQEDRR